MPKKQPKEVSIVELHRRLPPLGVTRRRIENAIRDGHIRVRRGRRPLRNSRRIDLASARQHFAKVRKAISSGRTTTDPWNVENGVWWLPAGPLAGTLAPDDDYPTRALIAKWWAYGCYLLDGKKLAGQILRAADNDSLVPTLFIRKSSWNDVKGAYSKREAAKAAAVAAKPAKRKQGERSFPTAAKLGLNPKLWVPTPEALKFMGLAPSSDVQLRTWNSKGSLDCKPGGRGGVTYWYKPHLRTIKKNRKDRRSADPAAIYKPFKDKKGNERIRLRAIRRYMKDAGVPEKDLPSDAVIRILWCPEQKKATAKRPQVRGCGALGGKVLDIIPWPSLNMPGPTESAVLTSQIDTIIEAYKKPDAEYDKTDFFEDETTGERFAPQRIACGASTRSF